MYIHTVKKMGSTTVRIPDELHEQAKRAEINVSLACLHGIRIHLGLKCPIKDECKCFEAKEKLQSLLLSAQKELEESKENYMRLKTYVANQKTPE